MAERRFTEEDRQHIAKGEKKIRFSNTKETVWVKANKMVYTPQGSLIWGLILMALFPVTFLLATYWPTFAILLGELMNWLDGYLPGFSTAFLYILITLCVIGLILIIRSTRSKSALAQGEVHEKVRRLQSDPRYKNVDKQQFRKRIEKGSRQRI